MGTITQRARKDGSIGYTAQIRLKEGGRVVFTEAQTFDRRQAAQSWLDKRERELAQPGARESAKQEDPLLADVIDRYIRESKRAIGRTKEQVLRTIKESAIGEMRCSQLRSQSYVSFAQGLKVLPQTAENYMSHLSAVVTVARPAWGYPLEEKELTDARTVLKKLGATGKSAQRDRRPTLTELDRILTHFTEIRHRRPRSAPMCALTAFAIFSTRRLEEMLRIEWKDLDEAGSRIMVRDLKHPGQKIGNDVWCDLVPEALRIIKAQPRTDDRIFPYGNDAVGMAFTRACQFLTIDDLHLHDMRHEGASRLFEMGWNIPHVATVTGHRSWASLKRYTHLRQTGDKFAGWKWLDIVAPPQAQS
ncbi:tyrosine-type recombinase/integrase [Paraburkholderia silvatlantica]|uniref:Integrase n=1 Tax=Paraburkholderia silvatlantica TaxID=321895 RepID=A0ABR6FLN7_9BURK|nr:tyrosine-type recombinase/integrase [Paraburkholderia silvatlantica]MBB2928343.1 integrase [Paraburkholderia silvatlantica]PVY34610.1 phage integrase family protein [Paraburkholderia silvatlantica]PXW38825.1 phage integrase family protein [Paraburkholderia silvatlantica]